METSDDGVGAGERERGIGSTIIIRAWITVST